MRAHYGRIDAVVTHTEADAAARREALEHPGLLTLAIPNAVPATSFPPSHTDSRIVMASGQLSDANRYDVLIRSYARIAASFPDWQLRIHGAGPLRRDLLRLISELGLHNHVFLMGRTDPMHAEWAKASIAVSTSQRDPFGLSLVQAMRAGLPVIATDCPAAPGEIIRHGVDGYLVPLHDIEAISRALTVCMGSPAQRKSVGASAYATSRRFDPERIKDQYQDLFAKITAGRRTSIARLAKFTQSLIDPRQTGTVPAFNPPLPQAGSTTCTVGADGTITIRPALSHRGQAVYLRSRRRDTPRETSWLRFPCRPIPGSPRALPPAAAIGPVDIFRLGEGRWDLFTDNGHGSRIRLTADAIDSRGALQAALRHHHGEVTHAVPYATEDGHLAIRSWRRLHHVEVTGIDYQRTAIVVHGRYIGEWGETSAPDLVLQRRQQPRTTLVVQDVTSHEQSFHCRIPVDELMHRRILREENWDLFLRDEKTNCNSRIGRLLDDSPNRKLTHRFPELVVEEPGAVDLFHYSEDAPRVAVRPYYTADNDLSMVVTELE
nr:glycosyltransferase [Streptomyces sp. BA2]